MAGGEFDLIRRHFAPLAKSLGAFGLADDAALLKPRGDLIVTADAIVAGVHFMPDDPPESIARKLLRVNLSDLAAKGATPLGYLMTAAFPKDADDGWIRRFARGLKADQTEFGLSLLGGDTVATPGPATFSVTMLGAAGPRGMIRRAGARPGDLVFVTGTIGDGGLGLAAARGDLTDPPAAAKRLAARYRTPEPRVAFGPALGGVATAALDVSDGLIQDAGHLARASGVALDLSVHAIPLSRAAVAVAGDGLEARLAAMSAGDDYEILFTAPPKSLARLEKAALETRTVVTCIGAARAGRGVAVVDPEGRPLPVSRRGYDHFAFTPP